MLRIGVLLLTLFWGTIEASAYHRQDHRVFILGTMTQEIKLSVCFSESVAKNILEEAKKGGYDAAAKIFTVHQRDLRCGIFIGKIIPLRLVDQGKFDKGILKIVEIVLGGRPKKKHIFMLTRWKVLKTSGIDM